MGNSGRGFMWFLGIVIGLGLVARFLIVDVWTIPETSSLGPSLAPTLDLGDTILVWKHGSPGFGDLVRCSDPDEAGKFVIGRIAGVSGDRVEVEGRKLIVNSREYEGEMACPKPTYPIVTKSGQDVSLHCDVVKMGSGWHYRGYGAVPPFGQFRTSADVGTGKVFLVSDDRDYHDDSRDFGAVNASMCKGTVFFRLWGKEGWGDSDRRFTAIH